MAQTLVGMTRRAALAMAAGLGWGAEEGDWRNIRNGWAIPREGYSDQPYVVVTREGHWLCVLTTGRGVEGESGQHIISTISRDRGRTWTAPVDIEPATGPEASWVMPLLVESGRVYVFYTYNAENRRVDERSNNPRVGRRVDTLGEYAFKYSDDGGRTWSRERHNIAVRAMRIDRENAHAGRVRYFWGVGKPIVTRRGEAMFGFAKVGKWGDPGTMVTSQGAFLKSVNIGRERDARKIEWVTLPEGDEGLRAPKGPVSDEANLVELSDGSLYATYRTIDGYNCAAYSRDGGRTWTGPEYAVYGPGRRRIKHPRAANFVRKFSNGKFLLWFHNHGGEAVHTGGWQYYTGRNPAWVAGGVERGGVIHWSEPEILLYDEDPAVRISYPDFVEDGGEFYVTETMKTEARVHRIDRALLEGMWGQFEARGVSREGLLLEAGAGRVEMPVLDAGRGFTLEFWVKFDELTAGQVLVEAGGVRVATTARWTLELSFGDGAKWESDAGTGEGTLRVGAWQHVAFVVDGGPRVISVVVDGVLNDGGAVREYGWGRYGAGVGRVGGGEYAWGERVYGEVGRLRVYGRALRTSEVVGAWRAGEGGASHTLMR